MIGALGVALRRHRQNFAAQFGSSGSTTMAQTMRSAFLTFMPPTPPAASPMLRTLSSCKANRLPARRHQHDLLLARPCAAPAQQLVPGVDIHHAKIIRQRARKVSQRHTLDGSLFGDAKQVAQRRCGVEARQGKGRGDFVAAAKLRYVGVVAIGSILRQFVN